MLKEIRDNPQVITEAIQTILRKYGCADAYEIVKRVTRQIGDFGRTTFFVVGLEVGDAVKQEILTTMHRKSILVYLLNWQRGD